MFATMDAIAMTGIFWPSIRTLWPMPFDLSGESSASIIDHDNGLAIVVSRIENEDSQIRVQVRKHPGEADGDVEIDVVLDKDGMFISGRHNGMGSDELGCADALHMFSPIIRGSWTLITDIGDEDVEE